MRRPFMAGHCRTFLAIWLACLPTDGSGQVQRDYVSIVATPDLRRYSETALALFGDETRFKFPELRITNLSAAIRLLCAGSGIEYPDIAFLWRPISDAQKQACDENVGAGVAEVLIGYEAIVAVRLKPSEQEDEASEPEPLSLDGLQLFTAMAEFVPEPANHPDFKEDASRTLVPNQYGKWSEIDTELPDREIYVVAPRRGHPDAEILYETVLGDGCRQIEGILVFEDSDPGYFEQLCENFRADERLETFNASRGDLVARLRTIEAGYGGIETFGDAMLYQAIPSAEEPLAIGFTRLHEMTETLEPIALDGALPELTLIRNGLYPAARPIHLLMKVQNFALVPGLRDFVRDLVSSRAIGETGYLAEVGLVPLSEDSIDRIVDRVFDAIREAASQQTAEASSGEAEANSPATATEIDELDQASGEP